MSSTDNHEIEVRFLEVDVAALKKRLGEIGAQDHGEELLEEIIFYDQNLEWQAAGTPIVRVRTSRQGTQVAYKHHASETATGTEEIEFTADTKEAVVTFLEKIGLQAYRHQQKKRHTFTLGDAVIDFDTWPKIPTFVEIEGPSEARLQEVAEELGLSWDTVVLKNPRRVIEENYGIPVGKLRYFTFDKIA